MSRLVALFFFLGVCVVAVHMSPTGTEEEAPKNRDKVSEYGRKVEAKVRESNKDFNWDQWWPEAQPVLKVIAEVVPANEKNKEDLCKDDDDDDSVMLGKASEIEYKVRQNGMTDFKFSTWWVTAKPVLKVIGEIAMADELKKYCGDKAQTSGSST